MPYNYAFDYWYRESHKEFIKDAILIFDEAHNIEQSAQEGSSFGFSDVDLKNVEKDLKKFLVFS